MELYPQLYSFHLFAGAGGGIIGDILLGHRTVGAVEIEEYRRGILLQRQLDGCLPRFPVWDDIRTFRFDNPATRSYILRLRDIRNRLIISGGFPCQDISAAGRGAGITGERSGLWKEMARIIGEVRPRYVLVENSPMLVVRGMGVVCGDLAALGYDAKWGVVSAADAIWANSLAGGYLPALDHLRERIWIVATRTSADGGRTWAEEQPGQLDASKCGSTAGTHAQQQRGERRRTASRQTGRTSKAVAGCSQESTDTALRRLAMR